MKLYKSNEPNTFHYDTLVTHGRAPVFQSDVACQLFVDVLSETRERYPYKLVGYVLMPDHAHAIINNRSGTSAWRCSDRSRWQAYWKEEELAGEQAGGSPPLNVVVVGRCKS